LLKLFNGIMFNGIGKTLSDTNDKQRHVLKP
ncbi:MAG: hypothetical protein ACJAWA_000070, partial [Nonlabens sp.]